MTHKGVKLCCMVLFAGVLLAGCGALSSVSAWTSKSVGLRRRVPGSGRGWRSRLPDGQPLGGLRTYARFGAAGRPGGGEPAPVRCLAHLSRRLIEICQLAAAATMKW